MVHPESGSPFDRNQLEELLRKRFFYAPAFQLYNGVAGLYDYGPPGCAIEANITDLWRKHFVLEDDMLEVSTTMLTPENVLKTSGHVDKFADWMCKDPKTGEIFRADHLIEEVLEARLKGDKEARGVAEEAPKEEDDKKAKRKKKVKEIKAVKLEDAVVQEYEEVLAKIDNYDGPQLGELIAKYKIRNPATDGELTPPIAFNLMFETAIGPSGALKGYLRPETAQGQFLNFNKLLEYNNAKMPFASASIGKSFRNEISPRAGLLRVREFLMAEIEHYVDPLKKDHPRFDEVKDIKMKFLPKDVQSAGKTDITEITIGEAVKMGMVDNTTLGYFLARIYLFLTKIGIDPTRMRFRQHMDNEMAHYACDCWDAELQTSYGWIECVGCADRSAYDLTVHSKATGEKLVVREALDEPYIEKNWIVETNKKKFGPKFKRDAKAVEDTLEKLSNEEKQALGEQLEKEGKITVTVEGLGQVEVEKDLILAIEERSTKISTREYTPNVIEPSFGIGRILYSLVEHSFWTRPQDIQRGVLSFPPIIAPTKCLLVPLSGNDVFKPIVKELGYKLRKAGISNKVDDSSAAIGRRYARNDELGTPFGITVDFQTVKDGSITLRERDSTKQIRASAEEVIEVMEQLIEGDAKWEDVLAKYGEFTGQQLDD
ncbi:Glycine--tRNA ligase 1, mitochondrial [Saitoella coloradoensis]